MTHEYKQKTLKYTFLLLCLIALVLGISFCMIATIEIKLLFIGIPLLALFLPLYACALIINKGYELKYYFLGESFKKQIGEAFRIYDTDDAEFKERLTKFAKNNYRTSGNIFSSLANHIWLYKDKNNLSKFKLVLGALNESANTDEGFVKFIDKTEKIESIDTYEAYNFTQVDLLSKELRYLIFDVYIQTNFSLLDLGLSEELTQKIIIQKEKLINVYSPILKKFKNEIANACLKIDSTIKEVLNKE